MQKGVKLTFVPNAKLYKSIMADKKIENQTAKEVVNYKEALWH